MSSRFFVPLLAAWYLVLAFGHYLDQRPLWNDEQCVLNNITGLQSTALFTRPLLSDQEFPRLYLWLIQQFSNVFHQSLLSLRFFSFLGMAGAFVVWLQIGRWVLKGVDLLLFLSCWCASMPLVYYAAELKPYSMDVLACGVIIGVLLKKEDINKTVFFLLPFLALFSYAALFLLILPLYAFIADSIKKHRLLQECSFFLVGTLIVLGLVYTFDLRVTAHHLMEESWHDYFISFDSLKHFFNSFGKAINNLVGRRFAENPHWLKGPSRFFMGLGLAYMLFKHKRNQVPLKGQVIAISLALLVIQLILACIRVFPFGVPRLSLFYSPLLYMMTIMAMTRITQKHRWIGYFLRTSFAGYLIFVSLGIGWNVLIAKNLSAESRLYESLH